MGGSALSRIIALVLTFVLGFFACFGILFFGGYLAYSKLTLDGMGVDTDSLLSKDAVVDLTAMSLAEIISEFASLGKDELTLKLMVDRYGLILSEDVDDFLTDELRTMPLSKVFAKDGANAVLSEIYIGKLFGYERQDNPAYNPSAPDAEPKYIWLDSETKEQVVNINGKISNITLAEFFSDGIDTKELVKDMTVGDLMELTAKDDLPVYIEDGEGMMTPVTDIDPIVIWYDRNGQEVATVVGALANQSIDDLNNEFSDIQMGQILGTVNYKGEYYTYDVKRTSYEYIVLSPAESVITEISDLSIEGLTGRELNDRVNNMLVADLLDYEKDPVTGKWMDSENREVNSIMAQIASSTVGNINQTIDGISFGEIAELVAVDANGDVVENPGSYEGSLVWYEKGYEKGSAENKVATGVIASLADLSVSEMSDESSLTDALKSVGVGDAMGYVKEGDTWYTDDTKSTEASNIMAALADSTVGDMNTKIGTITFAEIAGLTAVDAEGNVIEDVDAEEYDGIWYQKYYGKNHADNEPTTGLMAGLAHLTVDDLQNETKVSDAVKALKVGDAMGYHVYDGVWYSEYYGEGDARNKPLTGLVKAMADDKVGEMDETAKHVTIAEIAGLVAVDDAGNVFEPEDPHDYETYDGIWYEAYYGVGDARNKPTTGLMAGLAHLTMEDLQDSEHAKEAVGEITAGDAMGYRKVDGVWLDETDHPLTGLVKAIADSKVKDLNQDIQTTKFGEVAGLTYSGGVWLDEGAPATGIIASLADLTVAEISDEEALSNAIQKVTVADALGYKKFGDGYLDKSNNPVTGFMAVIAEKPISEIQTTLDTTEIGEFMGYEKVGTVWKKNGVNVDPLMQKVCSKTIDGLDGLLDTLVLKDVVEDYDDGIFSFVDENTKITELGQAFEDVFTDETNGVTMGELQAKGLIAEDIVLSTTVANMTFATFIRESNEALAGIH